METFKLLTLLLLVDAATAEYIFTFPKSLESNKETTFCLSAQNIEIENWTPGQNYELIVLLSLEQLKEPPIIRSNFRFNVAPITVADFSHCPAFIAPQAMGQYQANVTVSVEIEGLDPQELFSDGTEVKVTKPDYITLIQTDKPLYKPGQTVKFRAMTMDYQLMSQTFGFSEISVQAPNGLQMMKWNDVSAMNGLISREMPLSSEPLLGTWKIKATFPHGESETTFKVDEYVLPKFEVVITPPKYLLPTTQTIHGTVCAKYTYGKPVKGTLDLHVCFGDNSYSRSWIGYTDRPCDDISVPIDGCYDFYVNAEKFKLRYDEGYYYGYSAQLRINATVIEDGTGIELLGFSEGPALNFEVINLGFEDDSGGLYKPGFPYKGRVKVTNPDGSPAANEEIQITGDSYYGLYYGYYPMNNRNRKRFQWQKTLLSDDNGIIHFVINDVDPSIDNLRLRAEEVLFDKRYLLDSENRTYIKTRKSYAYHTITRVHSASDSFIYIPDIDQTPDCGSDLEIDVYYTTPTQSTYNFQSMVKAGDRIVHTKSHVITFDGISNFDIVAVRPDHILKKQVIEQPEIDPIPVVEEEVEEPPIVPEVFKPLSEAKEAEPVFEEVIVPEVVQPLGNEEKEARLTGHFKMTVPVTHDMSPDAQLLVYYMRNDGEIIASTVKFNIEKCFKNKVEMDFIEKVLTPGEEAVFRLKASPNSVCFVGMVDKSINLLGGQNQITPAQVFEKVRNVARPYNWVSYWRENDNYCDRKFPKSVDNPGFERYSHTYLTPMGIDAIKSFRDFNTWIVTDGIVETRPCKEEHRMVYYSMPEAMVVGNTGPRPMARRKFSKVNSEIAVEEEGGPEPDRIRSLFPETWLWNIYDMGDSNEMNISTVMPDTITEWIGNSLCTNPSDGIGVSELTSVTGFQPFFVSLTLPYAAVRTENMSVPVTVFNYLDKCIRIELKLEESVGFQISGDHGSMTTFCLCGSKSKTIKFYIMPVVIGEIEILVKAVSISDNGVCGNLVMTEEYNGVSDGVQKHLLVEAEGVPQERTKSEYMCVSEEQGTTGALEALMVLPDDLVIDSERAFVSVIGDIMGPTLSNLKNLLKMPYGCGEQNMASWSPNIYVLQYLKNTNQLSPKIDEEAKGYMRVGYQRQMKYRHKDYSYSAFGESNSDEVDKRGSIWLTAFVIKSMAQSAEFISIDEEDVGNSVNWILDNQDEDGCFPQIGRTFSSYLKGGLKTGENKAGLTAFIMIALSEAARIGHIGEDERFMESMERGFKCLSHFLPAELDTYTLTLFAYVLSFEESPFFNKWMQHINRELNSRAKTDFGLTHWERIDLDKEKTQDYWYRASSAEVEMTAYVALSMMKKIGVQAVPVAQPIIQWLTKQRNPYGGFSSTQDTVVALQALAMFGHLTYKGDSNLNVRVTNDVMDKSLTVTPDNLLLYQSVAVQPKDGTVNVEMTGTGCALVQVSTRYNVYSEMKQPAFVIDHKVFQAKGHKKNCAAKSLKICTRSKLNEPTNMAIIEVKMPTGWEAHQDSIEQLKMQGKIARFEMDKNYVQLYFHEITKDKLCVKINVEKTFETTSLPSVIRVYDYYETANSATYTYELKTTCPQEESRHVGTKEDIPKNNEGLDCSIMQCRVLDSPVFVPKGCPVCIESIADEKLSKIICDAERVYKANVARPKDFSIKLMADMTVMPKVTIDAFVNPEMGANCECNLLTGNTEDKAFLLTIAETWEVRNSPQSPEEVIKVGKETTIIKWSRHVEKKVAKARGRKMFCSKLERRRRSKERKLSRSNRRKNRKSRNML